MKRLATLVLAAGFSLSSLVAMVQGASATPFSDVPANHWAYQAIQSLAADGLVEGYPDGKFKGDRPLSRYEMAVLVARVIAKVQANGAGYASKADLDKLQKLIDALKDELDSLGVRVTNVEDALDALDKRTKFAQSLSMHASLNHNITMRQSNNFPRTIVNGTGVTQSLYFGGTDAAGRSVAVDPFVNAFLRSDESNSPIVPANSGDNIRMDDKINLSYAINENLTVSFPIHLLNYDYGGEFTPAGKIGFQPDILVNIAKAGSMTNAYMRFGEIDNLKSSRVGLTFRAPDASQQGPGFQYPFQPYQKGAEFGATFNGLTEVQVSFTRIDPTLINTQAGVLDQTGEVAVTGYLFPIVHNQTGYTQVGPPGGAALKSNTFTAGGGVLTQVYLGQKAQIGTVYISQYNGAIFNSNGQAIGGTAGVALPSFTYSDTYNAVIFANPLPAGSTVTITYVGLGVTNNTIAQRYEITTRINQKIKGLPGAEIGLSMNRIFDFDDLTTTADFTVVNAAPTSGYGLVSDTVLGLDAQLPLTFLTFGGDKTQHPILFGEAAASKFTPDFRNQAAVTDTAAVFGIRLKIYQVTASAQYQVVGANFLDGAPVRYFGNAPQLFAFDKLNYFPQFFGFANNLGINQQFDQFTKACTGAAVQANCTQQNPNLTFIYPVFNPFVASGSTFYSAFAPNSFGPTLNVNSPIRIGDVTLNARLLAQHLSEINPNSLGTQLYAAAAGPGGQQYVSNKRMTLDKVEGGAQFSLPTFGVNVGLNLTAGMERLSRQDKTPFTYVPINPGTLTLDPGAQQAGATAVPGIGGAGFVAGTVPFFPNFVDETHTTFAATANVPLSKDVVFGATYNTQGFHGSYGTTLTQNIAERKDTYVGSLTYNIPKTTSAVSLAVRHYRYNDLVLPTFNNDQNKEDLNFVVRF